MTSDQVNGLFEAVGAVMLMANVRRLHLDQEVRGVAAWPTAFFASWGLWNCFFYPANGLPFSFMGGLLLVAVNLVWLGQVAYYTRIRSWLEAARLYLSIRRHSRWD